MHRISISWYIFACTFLVLVTDTIQASAQFEFYGDHMDHELNFGDDVFVVRSRIEAEPVRSSSLPTSKGIGYLKLVPSRLNFRHRALGIPHVKRVTIVNIDTNRSIDMNSISGDRPHFQCSFFRNKRIPPLGNTTFSVVFLGRREGTVEGVLHLHTSEGPVKYIVKGVSVPSPYRLQPLVGIKLPINATFSPLISMYNPHTEPIQIMEIYSTGIDLQLELPSGSLEGPKMMWEIGPFQTKSLIRVNFFASIAQDYAAYIRIRLNISNELLIVPLEVNVSASYGPYVPQGILNFGMGGQWDSSSELELCVMNPLSYPLRIHRIDTSTAALRVQPFNVIISPNIIELCLPIAKLFLDWPIAHETKDFNGLLMIEYHDTHEVTEIPYSMTPIVGGLTYDPTSAYFYVSTPDGNMTSRPFTLRNDYPSPVRLIRVQLMDDAKVYFKIINFKPMVLFPNESASIFVIYVKPNVNVEDVNLKSHIILSTNLSDVMIPLLCFNGELHVELPYETTNGAMDLGLLVQDTTTTIYFVVGNNNPVTISLLQLHSSLPGASLKIKHCNGEFRLGKVLHQKWDGQNTTDCKALRSLQYAVMQLDVNTTGRIGQFWGDIHIGSHFKNISLEMFYRVGRGSLDITPKHISFGDCFPTRKVSQALYATNTYNERMQSRWIKVVPARHGFNHNIATIHPLSSQQIGSVFFDCSFKNLSEPYILLSTTTNAKWMASYSLTINFSADMDCKLLNLRYKRYMNEVGGDLLKNAIQEYTILLNTDKVKGYSLKASFRMVWPHLFARKPNSTVMFPIIGINDVSEANVTLRNPSDLPVIVHAVLCSAYPNLDVLLKNVPFSNNIKAAQFHNIHDFSLLSSPSSNSSVHIIRPGHFVKLRIQFHSRTHKRRIESCLVLRNNLTVIEFVHLVGRTEVPALIVENGHIDKNKSSNRNLNKLTFIPEDIDGVECLNPHYFPSDNFTIHRSLTLENMGVASIHVYSFHIDGRPCSDFGFNVDDCQPFTMLPDSSVRIPISYTPSFTVYHETRTLHIHTSLQDPVTIKLVAHISPLFVNRCSHLSSRPSWEYTVYLICIPIMSLIPIFIIVMSVIDSERDFVGFLRINLSRRESAYTCASSKVGHSTTKSEPRRKEIVSPVNQDTKMSKPEPILEAEKSPTACLVPVQGKKKKESSVVDDDVPKRAKSSEVKIKQPKVTSRLNPIKLRLNKYNTSSTSTTINSPAVIPVSSVLVPPAPSVETTEKTTDNYEYQSHKKHKIYGSNGSTVEKNHKRAAVISKTPQPSKRNIEKHAPNLTNVMQSIPKLSPAEVLAKQMNALRKWRPKDQKNSQRTSINKDNTCNITESDLSVSPLPDITKGEKKQDLAPVQVAPITTSSTVLLSSVFTLSASKPTMYVEPYTQRVTPLGPIGAERFSHDNAMEASSKHFSRQHSSVNSVMSTLSNSDNNIRAISSNSANNMNCANGTNALNSWSSANHPNMSNGVWKSNSTINKIPFSADKSNSWRWHNTETTVPQTLSGYLWGSSSIWEPWTPSRCTSSTPATPTRVPPGFENQRRTMDDASNLQVSSNDLYRPFDSSPFWNHTSMRNQFKSYWPDR